jgi:hypothetical protein
MGVDATLKRVEQPGTSPRRRRLVQIRDLAAQCAAGSGLELHLQGD